MEGLSAQILDRVAKILRKLTPAAWYAPSVKGIPDERMPYMSQMHPDLMRSPGKETTLEKANGSLSIDGEGAVACHRLLPPAAQNRHFLAVARASTDVSADFTFSWVRLTPDQSKVAPRDAARRKLCRQRMEGRLVLDGDHHATGVLVEAVDDARSPLSPDARQLLAAVGDERVDQSPVRVAGSRMDNQAGRFVDHDQVAVLVKNGEVQWLSRRRCFPRLGNFYGETLFRFDPCRGLNYCRRAAVDRSLFDELFDPAARHPHQAGGEESVQPQASLLHLNGEAVAPGRRGIDVRRIGWWCGHIS